MNLDKRQRFKIGDYVAIHPENSYHNDWYHDDEMLIIDVKLDACSYDVYTLKLPDGSTRDIHESYLYKNRKTKIKEILLCPNLK